MNRTVRRPGSAATAHQHSWGVAATAQPSRTAGSARACGPAGDSHPRCPAGTGRRARPGVKGRNSGLLHLRAGAPERVFPERVLRGRA